jgi:ElaB/YqjD/DUF883 family membrane-anchored ribosome-binding protein
MSDYQNQSTTTDSPIKSEDAGSAKPRRTLDKTLGKVEDAVGRTFGEPARQRVRETAESAVGAVEDVYGRARSRVDQQLANDPYKALAVALGAGLVLGLLLGRRSHTIIYQPRD